LLSENRKTNKKEPPTGIKSYPGGRRLGGDSSECQPGMFFLPRLKRINTDAFIAASTITQFTSFSEDEIHAIQFAECLAEECNPGVTFIHNLRMKFTDVFSVDVLRDRISDPDRNEIKSVLDSQRKQKGADKCQRKQQKRLL